MTQINIRKIINIFIGSSINDFSEARHELVGYIYSLSDDFESRYGIRIRPLLCEYTDPAKRREGTKQEDYDDLIRQSEMSFFLFFTRAGEFSVGEYELACRLLREYGKPKVYIYFKNVPEGTTVDESLRQFMASVDRDHYHGTFDSIDTIKLRILENLKFQEFEELPIEMRDGKVYAGGVHVLDIENVAEFCNNRRLAELRKQLEETEARYFPMKAQYDQKRSDPAFYRTYSDIASKRQSLLDEIEELEKRIFDFSLNMSRDTIHGDITPRQKEAYRLFEQGDLHGANAVMDADELDDEFLRVEREKTRELQENARRYIRQYRTKIDILSAMTDYDGRFAEIRASYEKIAPVAEKYRIEVGVLYDYAGFLEDQKDFSYAHSMAQRLQALYADDALATEDKLAALDNLLGNLYSDLNDHANAEEFYRKAIAIREDLASKNPDAFNPDLAKSYNNAGVLYDDLQDYPKAEEFYLKAISIREALAGKNPDAFNPNLATSYNNAGNLYYALQDYSKAEEFYLKAIAIREDLASKNPDAFNPDLASSYNNAGVLYRNLQDYPKAEEFYLKAIAIREDLASKNPDAFNPDLADSYKKAGNLYADLNDHTKAEEFYLKAFAVREDLASKNPDAFNPGLASSYNNAGLLYSNPQDHPKAEKFFLKAIAIREALASKNPDAFNPDLASSYNNAGNLYYALDDYSKAEEFYLKAIAIRENLASKNPDAFNPNLAMSYYNAGVLYDMLGNLPKAAQFFSMAAQLYEQLYNASPKEYQADLKDVYETLSKIYKILKDRKKAKEYRKKAKAL